MILKDAYNHISIEKFPYEPFRFPRNMTLFWLVDCGLALYIYSSIITQLRLGLRQRTSGFYVKFLEDE